MNKPIIIVIPGFNTNSEYIYKLKPYIEKAGYECRVFMYRRKTKFMLLNVLINRFRTKALLKELVNLIYILKGRNIILLAHSNGAMLAWAAINLCQFVAGVVAFNSALNRNATFKKWVINCYCETDKVLKWGARFRPFSDWGDYGARKQAHVGAQDFNLSDYGVKGHSDFIDHLDLIMPELFRLIKKRE